jgi:hypothetical protein
MKLATFTLVFLLLTFTSCTPRIDYNDTIVVVKMVSQFTNDSCLVKFGHREDFVDNSDNTGVVLTVSNCPCENYNIGDTLQFY